MTITVAIVVALPAFVFLWWINKKPAPTPRVGFKFPDSEFRFSFYLVDKSLSNDPKMVSESNQIDELGYQIYKSYVTDLDKIDILIRENQTGEVMKIVKNSDSESMIGVRDPEHGHIGFLQYETVRER